MLSKTAFFVKIIDRSVFVVDADGVVAFCGVFLVNIDWASTQTLSQILTKNEIRCLSVCHITRDENTTPRLKPSLAHSTFHIVLFKHTGMLFQRELT